MSKKHGEEVGADEKKEDLESRLDRLELDVAEVRAHVNICLDDIKEMKASRAATSLDGIQNGGDESIGGRLQRVSESLENIIKRNHLLTKDR